MEKTFSRFLHFILILMISGILCAGLYPFNFLEKNRASIDTSKQLIRFKKPSFALIKPVPEKLLKITDKPFTLQIRLKALSIATQSVQHIFSIYKNNLGLFTIGQWKSGVLFRFIDIKTGLREEIYYKDAFKSNETVLLTLCCEKNKTVLFQNDKVVRNWDKPVPVKHLSQAQGIILGNSADGTNSWNGQIHEIMFYNRLLSPVFINNQCKSLFSFKAAKPFSGDNTIFRISFDRQNSAVLSIPELFRPPVLCPFTPPWVDFRFNHSYIVDVIVNVLGFIPFGALLCYLLFMNVGSFFKSIIFSGSISAVISFTIEFLQIYLPFRSSQLSDLILNVSGGLIGSVMICIMILSYKRSVNRESENS